MPKIKDPSSLLEEKIAEAEKRLSQPSSPPPAPKPADDKGEKRGKKQPNWPLLYVLFALAFFGLGILIIMLTNFLRGAGFTL